MLHVRLGNHRTVLEIMLEFQYQASSKLPIVDAFTDTSSESNICYSCMSSYYTPDGVLVQYFHLLDSINGCSVYSM